MDSQIIAVVGESDVAFICHILARQNLNVVPIPNVGDALTRLESIDPALLLLDLPQSGSEADDLCKTIRRNLHTRYVPVLVLSPTDKPWARVAAFQAGADDFLGKPFDPIELILRVYALLRRSAHIKLLHPLSGLPTSTLFRQEVESRVAGAKEGALIYCELEGLGALGDRHGFEQGNRVLVLLAQILLETSTLFGHTQDILGHISDDGFAIFTACANLGEYAQRINQEFSDRVLGPCDEQDCLNKYFVARHPNGQEQDFHHLRLTIGVVRCSDVVTCSYARLLELAKEAGAVARGFPARGYFINRRTCPMSTQD